MKQHLDILRESRPVLAARANVGGICGAHTLVAGLMRGFKPKMWWYFVPVLRRRLEGFRRLNRIADYLYEQSNADLSTLETAIDQWRGEVLADLPRILNATA